MTELKRVSPEEAKELLDQGYTYVDVRAEPEFEAGHVPGALNVPLLHMGPQGMVPNPDFLKVMESAFGKTEKLVTGCKAGGRSLKAAQQLLGAGFQNIVDMRTGWDGGRDDFGRPEPGWSKKGLPVETGNPQGQTYEDVKSRTPV